MQAFFDVVMAAGLIVLFVCTVYVIGGALMGYAHETLLPVISRVAEVNVVL